MIDRMLMGFLWLTIMSMIMFTAGLALFLAYRGLYSLIIRQYPTGAASLGGGLAVGIACYCLVRNGDDLMDR